MFFFFVFFSLLGGITQTHKNMHMYLHTSEVEIEMDGRSE